MLYFSCLNGCFWWWHCSRLWAWNGLPLNTYISVYARTNRCYIKRGSRTNYVRSRLTHCIVSCIEVFILAYSTNVSSLKHEHTIIYRRHEPTCRLQRCLQSEDYIETSVVLSLYCKNVKARKIFVTYIAFTDLILYAMSIKIKCSLTV